MKMKVVAIFAFVLNTVLFGTYYAVSKEALGRIDPIVFSFFEMMSLAPAALCIIVLSWHRITMAVVRRGVLLGSCLCLALFTISIALKYSSATGTAFFPSLNGFLAAFIAWIFLRQPIGKATWFAGLLSLIGAVLLILNSQMGGVRGSLIAFLGGVFFTCYVFLSDHEQKDETAHWPLFGIELLTMAVWANLVVLLFGDWQAVHPDLPKDIWVVIYIAGACTFVPTLIAVLMQKYVSPVTVSFIYILEPVLGAVMANIYLHERLSLNGYLGGGLVVVGAVIHTWGSAARPATEPSIGQRLSREGRRMYASLIGTLIYPIIFLGAGAFILYGLGGFPPPSWRTLYQLAPQLVTLVQQGQSTFVILLVAQAGCWLIAWIALMVMGLVAMRRTVRKLTRSVQIPAVPALEVRALSQVSVTAHPLPAATARRKVEMPVVERRRRERQQRFNRVELTPIEMQYPQSWQYAQTDQSDQETLMLPPMLPGKDKSTTKTAKRLREFASGSELMQSDMGGAFALSNGSARFSVPDRGTEFIAPGSNGRAAFFAPDTGDDLVTFNGNAGSHVSAPDTRPRYSAPGVIEVWQEG